MVVARSEAVLFEEHRSLRQPWVWIVVAAASLTMIGVLGYGPYQQLHLGKPFGTNPVSDNGLILLSVICFAISVALPLLVLKMRLHVRVSRNELCVRYAPFVNRRIPLKTITCCEAVDYRPLRDYGGWGIRFTLTGKDRAYNVHGNRGVQLELSNGKRVLIGSQRPEELASAIEAAKRPI